MAMMVMMVLMLLMVVMMMVIMKMPETDCEWDAGDQQEEG